MTPPTEATITPTDAAKILGLSEVDYVYRLLRTGVLAGRRVGNRWEIEAESVHQGKLRIEQKTQTKNNAVQRREARRAAFAARYPTTERKT